MVVIDKPILLLLSGKARSGKDTFAELVREEVELGNTDIHTDVAILAFADILKDVCRRNHYYENKTEDRDILINIGDDMRQIDLHVFARPIAHLATIYLKMGYKLIIVTDVRYKDEYDFMDENVEADVITVQVSSPFDLQGVSEFAKKHPTENLKMEPHYNIFLPEITNDNYKEIKKKIRNFINTILRDS